ncbi:MAG: hypothetical protein GTO45_24590 [Candidatus Aminicenantes bacterium]|nr:hypothetical protein [Candidatus Aminicenantes bacterium]NIM81933.1 hypothetical protein [Candidatus Aminicenantes bacterium]NIN21310.1 hypothetical protein [Candidatus Aminicenantes bacterium]NIN45131.1 hypothetical protein [Candidatus Aminicenantes bacterium]NIN87948.1 hypothetical protein [Candidatus Aminicenantes bacterium]
MYTLKTNALSGKIASFDYIQMHVDKINFSTGINKVQPGTMVIVGIPFDRYSSFLKGSSLAPRYIRDAFHSQSSNTCTEGVMDLNREPRLLDLGDLEINDYINDIRLPVFDGPVYLSLDMDVLDPAFAPGLSHYEAGGLSTRDVLRIIQGLEAPVVGADIVELNPKRDLHNMTAMAAAKFLKEIVEKLLK